MNWKTCFLPLLLAAVMLGSVTAFADGEPAAPETTEPTEITSEETAGSWKDNAYTDNQGIVYELNENSITVTRTILGFQGGEITIPATIKKGWISYPVTSVETGLLFSVIRSPLSPSPATSTASGTVLFFAHCAQHRHLLR